jgi:protein Jumonji
MEPTEKPKSAPNSKKKEIEEKKNSSNVKEKRLTRNSTVNLPTSTPKNNDDTQSDDEPLLIKSEPRPKKSKSEVENLNNTDSKILKIEKESTTSQAPVKSNRGRKKKIVETKIEDNSDKEDDRKKKKIDTPNTAENSENEQRSRPSRKTKEAATIYMEIIGRKLTLHDSSDNDSSLDSLEIPNLKRVELMENELKANMDTKTKQQVDKKPSISSPVNNKKQLDKSFSDSDEEPLASKVKKPEKPAKAVGKKRGRKSNQELAEIAMKKNKETEKSTKNDQQKIAEVTKILENDSKKIIEIIDKDQGQNSTSAIKDAINLLPSKEESEKIFGIASVTLAQSCGPLDTKCTLGKCGSMHSLKPPVAQPLTESALGSPKDRRKSKVNMTRDQIQKWLEEASWTPIPQDDVESTDAKTLSKASSSVGFSKSGEDSQSSSNLKEKCDQSSNSKMKDQKSRKESTSSKLFAKLNEKIKSTFSIQDKEVATKTETKPEPKKNSEKKTPVYNQSPQNQRRTPVYNKTETKPSPKLTPLLPKSLGAFSPENEHSIYSFDKEDDDIPATPFRRNNSKSDENIKTPAKPSASHVSLSLSPDENKKTAAISVDLLSSLKKNEKQLIETIEKDEDSDSEGHTFYIPLQASSAAGSKTIQGVAVKLGTEGEEGPNQRIIMHAKLVTKNRANATPLPESMSNVQDLVKSLIASKEMSKSVPCATVQPRFKASDLVTDNHHDQPSSSNSNQRTRQQAQQKQGMLQEAPVFRPTESEFADPIEYIERITPIASPYGICRIIPPDNFKPECRISDEMRFNAYNQYVHKMLHRWGPSAKEFSAIKKYLATQSIVFQRPPLIAGIEVDLPRLYHTVQELGGLKEVIEKKKWVKVAEEMCIPKTAHDRVTKLDDIYCKYLLPYDTLSQNERQKLFDEVEAEWSKKEAKARRNADKTVDSEEQSNESEEESEDDEEDDASMECMVKGKSMALSQFYRVARNMLTLWFKTNEPTVSEIEAEYWRHVAVRDSHVCVHYGSIDSSGYGYGFPMAGPKTKSSPCSKHPWNLKVLTNNQNSILRSLGPVMGVTIPTLHVGMLFSAVCWYRDPHGLPWIEYLHTGSSKIWYAVPDSQSQNFRNALTSLVPSHCQNKTIWLPCDTTMVR